MKNKMMEHKVIDCSLKSILSITLPMMLSSMSSNLMYVIDRFMLSGYSVDSMNAVMLAGTFVAIFSFLLIGIADAAEIFTGQYNGSKQYEKLALPTWQMIYMGLFAYIPCFLIGYFSDRINLFPSYYMKDGVEYQRILMCSMILPPLKAALASFFVGHGKTKIITYSVAIGAVSNISLDYLMIYGVKGVIPSMGAIGAATATVIAELIQVIILATVFFSKNNRKVYKTFESHRFNKKLFLECLRVGFPIAIGNALCLMAYYVIQDVVSHTSKDMATIYGFCINIYTFFMSVGEGANKGVSAIASNMIGRNDLKSIEKVRKVFMAIAICFGIIVAVPLISCEESLFSLLNMILPNNVSRLYSEIKTTFCLLSLNIILDTLVCATWGILIAGGDTKYAMSVWLLFMWFLTVFPTAALYYANALTSVPVVFIFMTIQLTASLIFIHRRYKSLKWYNKLV